MKCAQKLCQKLGEKGQALVEYMLLLVVVISIILGAIYQLNLAFQTWADAYFGEYVMCLLETGELPSIGANNDPNAQCSKPQFRAEFDEGEGASGDGSDSSNNNENNASGSSSQSSSGGGGSSRSRGGRSGDAEGAGRLSGTSSRFQVNKISGGAGSEEDEGSSILGGAAGRGSYYNANDGRPKRTKISGNFVKGKLSGKKDDKKKKKKTTSVKQDPDEKERIKLFKVEQRKPASNTNVKIESFSLGDWLRYLIMIAILIMAIFFIGGQALQILKSMEK